MTADAFADIDHWIFDLDNTLYSARYRLFDQIDERMGSFIAELLSTDRAEARRVQKDFFFRYGTTLKGLMEEHRVDPAAFLNYVHDIDHSVIPDNQPLNTALANLPGRKFIFTNGTVAHANSVLNALGVTAAFDGIFDIEASDFIPKPTRRPYEKFIAEYGIEAKRAAMFEDIARNLEVPHDLGMVTVLVDAVENDDGTMINKLNGDADGAHYVHHTTAEITDFLAAIAPEKAKS